MAFNMPLAPSISRLKRDTSLAILPRKESRDDLVRLSLDGSSFQLETCSRSRWWPDKMLQASFMTWDFSAKAFSLLNRMPSFRSFSHATVALSNTFLKSAGNSPWAVFLSSPCNRASSFWLTSCLQLSTLSSWIVQCVRNLDACLQVWKQRPWSCKSQVGNVSSKRSAW